MNFKFLTGFLFIFSFIAVKGNVPATAFDKSAFYSALASDNVETINSQLALVKASSFSEKDAYEGVLLMKKAGMVSKTKEKLALFKSGRSKLETAISRNKENAEFSFLRLIIQENAPKMLDYNSNIQADIASIRSGFKTLAPVVQQAINDYSKKSKNLKPL